MGLRSESEHAGGPEAGSADPGLQAGEEAVGGGCVRSAGTSPQLPSPCSGAVGPVFLLGAAYSLVANVFDWDPEGRWFKPHSKI